MIDIITKSKKKSLSNNKVINTLKQIKLNKFKEHNPNDLLIDIKEYSFIKKPTYKKIRDYIWDIRFKCLVGEWFNWIIVDHPKKLDYIIKIAKPFTFDLTEEAKIHNLFYKKIEELKNNNNIDINIRVPKINSKIWNSLYYIMEKINWHNFTSMFYFDYYKEFFNKYKENEINELNDKEIKILLQKKWYKVMNCSEFNNNQVNDKLLEKVYEWWWNKQKDLLGINKVFETLEKEWYMHKDWHWWNVMKSYDWKIYLIDFWTSEVLSN